MEQVRFVGDREVAAVSEEQEPLLHPASASEDTTLQVCPIDVYESLNLARSRVTRNFTPEECQRYFQSNTCPPLP
jgi:hypothetical protein